MRETGTQHFRMALQLLGEFSSHEEFYVRVKMLCEHFMAAYASDLDIHKIINRELEKNSAVFQKTLKNVFITTIDHVRDYLARGQAEGYVYGELDVAELAAMLQGMLAQVVRIDHVRKGLTGCSITQPKEREKIVRHLAAVFLGGVGPSHLDSR